MCRRYDFGASCGVFSGLSLGLSRFIIRCSCIWLDTIFGKELQVLCDLACYYAVVSPPAIQGVSFKCAYHLDTRGMRREECEETLEERGVVTASYENARLPFPSMTPTTRKECPTTSLPRAYIPPRTTVSHAAASIRGIRLPPCRYL